MISANAHGTVNEKKLFRVGTVPSFPYVMVSRENGTVTYSGFCIDLLDIISYKMNFSYNLVQPTDGEFGVLRDGHWTGVMGMLERQEIDMTAASMSLTTKRMQVADWTMPFDQDFVVVTVHKVENKLGLWAVFLSSFTWQAVIVKQARTNAHEDNAAFYSKFLQLNHELNNLSDPLQTNDSSYHRLSNRCKTQLEKILEKFRKLYLCILFVLLCCPCLLYIIDKVHNFILHLRDRLSVCEVVEFFVGSLLQEAMSHSWTKNTERVVVACWCLFSLLLSSCYTCLLTSQMMKVTSVPPFTSLEEMVTQSEVRWGMQRGTVNFMALMNSNDHILQKIYNGAITFSKTDPDVLSVNSEVHLKKLLEGNYAFIEMTKIMKRWIPKHCAIAVLDSAKVSGNHFYTIYALQNWTLTRDIQKTLLELQETGVLAYLRSKWFPPPTDCQYNRPRTITLATLQGPFYVSVAGLVVALGVLITECCVRKWRQRKYFKGDGEYT